MPTLNKYAVSNEKTGYFIRANVGGSHPVTLQTTKTAEQIFKDNGYSDGSSIPTKLVWSMYDVDLVYTESSVSSSTPSYSFDSLSDAVTGSQLTEGTRQDLVRYFDEYSGAHETKVNEVLSELRREITSGSIEPYDSSAPVQSARNLLSEYSSKSGDSIERFLDNIGESARRSLLVFGQRASQIIDIDLHDQSTVAYQFAPLSVPGEVTVFDLTTSSGSAGDGQHEYRIEYDRKGTASIYVRDGTVQKVSGATSNISSSQTRRLAAELTPVKIDKTDITSTVDAPRVSELDIPEKVFLQSDSDLVAGVVDRISNSDNPLVETTDGHLLLDSGDEGGVYLIDRIESRWGRVLCELTQSEEDEETLADTMPLLGDEAFRDAEIEQSVVDAAATYHDTHHEIIAAQVADGRLEYATRAVLPDGTSGPRCGFSVGGSEADSTILEVIAHPDNEMDIVEYGDPGIRHHVVLANGVTQWETAVPPEFEDWYVESRDTLLTNQVAILQIMNETLELHTGCDPESLIPDVVGSGDLEAGITHPSGVWADSPLLGELLAKPESDADTPGSEKCTGIVDFFNDTGGYGFIETDACEDDVFYHMEDIGGPDIQEGEELRFSIVQAEKGPRAKNVERV
jgi:CspA family cold shock protein